MGRGKIEIKRIENPTNRQVTYSKRRAGIVKKAKELNVLCDAGVSLIMFSSTGKCTDYTSPNTTMKKFFQKYQQISGRDLWKSHYQQMQDTFNKLKETNTKLRKEIGQRVGEDLNDLSIDELRGLEHHLDSSLKIVIQRKFNVIATQTETCRKKIRNLEEINTNLFQEYEERIDDAFALANNEGVSAIEMSNKGRDLVTKAILEAGGKVDYAEFVDQESLEAVEEIIKRHVVVCVAAWFGEIITNTVFCNRRS